MLKHFYFMFIAGTNAILKMWKSRAAAPLNMIHLGYSSGAILANLLVRPFMSKTNTYRNTNITSQYNFTYSTSVSVPAYWDIRVPYLISAALCFIVSIGHLIFFIREQNKAEQQKVSHCLLEN